MREVYGCPESSAHSSTLELTKRLPPLPPDGHVGAALLPVVPRAVAAVRGAVLLAVPRELLSAELGATAAATPDDEAVRTEKRAEEAAAAARRFADGS